MSGVEHAIHGQLLVTAEIEVEGWLTCEEAAIMVR